MKNRNTVIYVGSWGVIIIVTLIDFMCASRAGFRIGHGWPFSMFSDIGIVFAISAGLIGIAAIDRYRQLTHALRCKEFATTLICLITFAAWGPAISIASYIGISLNVPTIADILVRFDKAIGFDWLAAYHWVESHRGVRIVFRYAYWSAFAQLILVPVALAIARRPDDIAELLLILFVSSVLLMLISIPFPAESAFLYFGITDPGTVSTVRDFTLLRSGALRVINPYEVQGLVSMPSFHTMIAIFFAYSMRHVRFLFPAAVMLNAVMIVSTITVGGHYLADVLAGIFCGFAVVWAVRLAFRRQATYAGNAYRAANPGGSASTQ